MCTIRCLKKERPPPKDGGVFPAPNLSKITFSGPLLMLHFTPHRTALPPTFAHRSDSTSGRQPPLLCQGHQTETHLS